MLNDLPQELLDRIVQLLKYDAPTLRNLCLTSRRFPNEARLHLYANIGIVPDHETLRPRIRIGLKRSKKFLTTLVTHNPALAKHVRCFVYSAYFVRDIRFLVLQGLVLRGLQLMTNIKILEFTPMDGHVVPANLLQGCTFQLTHFRCNFGCSTEFMLTQPTLQSLYSERNIEAVPSDCCTNLKSLHVRYWRDILNLVPGRSIRHLEYTGVWRDEPLSAIATELGNITVLVSEYPLTLLSRGFEAMIPFLTHLRLLKVGGGSLFIEKLSLMPEIMLGLPNLGIFIYSIGSGLSSFFHEFKPERYPKMVNIWFQKMPKFEVAYFQMANHGYTPKNYERWLANDTTPTLVGREEALQRHGFYDSYAEEYEVTSAPY